MRLDRRRLVQAIAAGAVFWAGPAGFAAESPVGTVSDITGAAVAELNTQRRTLKKKSPIYINETLRTAAQSRLGALLARKTRLRLGAETTVRIDRFIVDRGGDLMLDSGALLIDIKGKMPKGFEVQSPFALIAVRGTKFFAGPIDGIFGVFVERGEVDVTGGGGGAAVRLNAGEGTDILHAGAAPGPVKKWGAPKIAKAMALVN